MYLNFIDERSKKRQTYPPSTALKMMMFLKLHQRLFTAYEFVFNDAFDLLAYFTIMIKFFNFWVFFHCVLQFFKLSSKNFILCTCSFDIKLAIFNLKYIYFHTKQSTFIDISFNNLIFIDFI